MWDGANPHTFYDRYMKEMERLDRFEKDPSRPEILRAVQQWRAVHNWRNQLMAWNSHTSFKSSDVLGIDLQLFQQVCTTLETSILRLLLALLEGQREDLIAALTNNLDTDVIIQNMDNVCR